MKQTKGLLMLLCIMLLGVACGGAGNTATAVPPTAVPPTSPETNEVTTLPPTVEAATVVPTAAATTETIAPTAAIAASSGDAQTDIMAAMQKMIDQPYRSETLVTTADGSITIIGEFALPDSLHVSTQATGFNSEMILIGAEGWQAIDGVWQTMAPETITLVAETVSPSAQLEQLQLTILNAQTLGQQQLNGRDVWVYQYENNTEGVTSTAVLYIDAETGLPVQQEVTGNAGGIDSTTVQTITYDDVIAIVPPMP